MTSRQTVEWLEDALTGYAKGIWNRETNPWMDVENDHLLDDENCHRHAIEWLRVYLYKSAEPEKRRQWNRTRFILQADKPADKQLERYFELLRNLQLDLPAYMHHTGILAAKLDFVFGKHAWYLWDQTDIDLGADDGPDKVLEKAKRAYRRFNDIRNAVAAAKSTLSRTTSASTILAFNTNNDPPTVDPPPYRSGT